MPCHARTSEYRAPQHRNVSVAYRGGFFYVSYITSVFVVADNSGKILQSFSIGNSHSHSHSVAVDPRNGDVWVPQDQSLVALSTPVGDAR